jgi:hypothetical protein
VLVVKDASVDGKQLPDPTRLPPNVSIPAMTEARLMAADDLKALTGIYDAALGAKSNETSGLAIQNRQAQSDTANFHFTGNLVRSVNHSSRLIIGALPTIYDTARSVRIIGEGDAHKVVKINQEFEEGQQTKRYDYSAGKYDVVCEAGPNPATKQQQDAALMTEIIKVAPQLMQVAPDLILKSVGAPIELVERVRKTLPPELQDQQDKQESNPEDLQKIQALTQQLQQMDAFAQQCQQQLNDAQHGVEIKKYQIDKQHEFNLAKLNLEQQKMQVGAMSKAEELHSRESIAGLQTAAQLTMHNSQLDAQQVQQAQQAAEQV